MRIYLNVILMHISLLGIVESLSTEVLPTFASDSHIIDNKYVRFDQFPQSQNFTGWGPTSSGKTFTYYDLRKEQRGMPDYENSVFIQVQCRKILISDGNLCNDITTWFAQDVLDDVYIIRMQLDPDGDCLMDVFAFPTRDYPKHVPLYMPAHVVNIQ